MGSDLTFSDMTKKDAKHYKYKLLKQEIKVRGESCWLIASRPKTPKERRETGYIKSHVWISKSKLIPLRSKAWVREGKKLKYMKFSKIKKVDGIWTPHRISVRTVRGRKIVSSTVLHFGQYTLNNAAVKASDFTQRRLERGL